MKRYPTKIEQTTTIEWNSKDDIATICTFSRKMQKKLEGYGFKAFRSSDFGKSYKIPRSWIDLCGKPIKTSHKSFKRE